MARASTNPPAAGASSPPETDWSDVDALLAVLDPPKEFQSSCIHERAFGNGCYRVIRDGGELSGGFSAYEWVPAFLNRTLLDRDQATYLELMRKTIATSAERNLVDPWWTLEEEFDARVESRHSLLDGTIWMLILPPLPSFGRWCLGERARIHLIRAALIARREGADAAVRWLADMRDPFNGEPLRTRLSQDGILAMWSVGENREDDPLVDESVPALKPDDIRVEVRAR